MARLKYFVVLKNIVIVVDKIHAHEQRDIIARNIVAAIYLEGLYPAETALLFDQPIKSLFPLNAVLENGFFSDFKGAAKNRGAHEFTYIIGTVARPINSVFGKELICEKFVGVKRVTRIHGLAIARV